MKFALFLRFSQGIDIKFLIEILGGTGQFNLLVLEKYISSFNFENMELILSLRVMFSNFLMFGES